MEFSAEQQFKDIQNNLSTVKQRIVDACKKAGRDPASVRLLPVTKTVPAERLRIAYAAGCHEMGENKIQEAREKSEVLSDLNIKWAVIGHLQTNKAKYLARFANEFQALDSLKVAEELDKRLQNEGRAIDVYVQVNSSGEASKFGLPPEDVRDFVQKLPNYSSLRIKGLMTLAIFSSDHDRVRECLSKCVKSRPCCARKHRLDCHLTSYQWACREITNWRLKKVQRWCGLGRRYSVSGHCRIVIIGPDWGNE